MAVRTITQPATGSSLSSSVVRNQLQILENEIADPASIDPGHLHTTSAIDATGTPSSSTFLRGDNSWATPTSGNVTFSTPTGTVNGSNQDFVSTGTPSSVIADGITYFEGLGYSFNSGTNTITMDIPPSQFIRYTL